MVNQVTNAIRPKSGFSHFFHIFFTAIIPLLMYIFVQLDLVVAALAIVLLSKWRTLAVRPRHWWANIRSNGVDISVGIAALVFMTQTASTGLQILVAVLYGVWLLFLKPQSGVLAVSVQAIIGQTAGLMALYLGWGDMPGAVLVLITGLIAYVSARHFFTAFDEPHAPLYSHTWGYLGASLAWLLHHWLLFYGGVVAQIVLLMTVIGFGLAALYYLEQTDRLSVFLRRQFLFIMVAIIIVVIVFSDWGDQAI